MKIPKKLSQQDKKEIENLIWYKKAYKKWMIKSIMKFLQ